MRVRVRVHASLSKKRCEARAQTGQGKAWACRAAVSREHLTRAQAASAHLCKKEGEKEAGRERRRETRGIGIGKEGELDLNR
eukprot:695468-Pleurochrysis_carterae.AAC.1